MTPSATWIARAAVLALLPLAACAQTERVTGNVTTEGRALMQAATNPTLSTTDAYFLDKAARGGLAAMQEAQLAEKAGSVAVRRSAARLVAAQARLNAELDALAQQKRISLPTTPSDAQERMMGRLQGLSGAAFDRQYLDQQVLMHQQAVSLFQDEARNGADPEVKAFAVRAVPALETTLRTAEQLGGRAPQS